MQQEAGRAAAAALLLLLLRCCLHWPHMKNQKLTVKEKKLEC
jgi:hypothetical protein